MTKRRSSKKSSPQQIAKDATKGILFILFYVVATILFYSLLTVGALLTVVPLFQRDEHFLMLFVSGVVILLFTFGGNALVNRIFTGKWTISWPGIPGVAL